MPQNIIEHLREYAINKLFGVDGFSNAFPVWRVCEEKSVNTDLL